MRLDKDTLLDEVAGHQERMRGPLWAKDSGEPDDDWTASLRNPSQESTAAADSLPTSAVPPIPPSMPREHFPEPSIQRPRSPDHALPREEYSDPSMSEILPRLDALDHAVERLTSVISRRPIGREGFPGWLEGVAGDPHSYDGPDSARKGVCVRILPSTYAQLQMTQRRMGLRTVAAAWEFLLRLGFAAAERLPA